LTGTDEKRVASIGILTRILMGILVFLVTVGLFYTHLFLFPIKLQIGQLVPFTIASPVDTEWVDSEEYAKVMSKSDEGWVLDPTVADGSLKKLNDFFSEVYALRDSDLPLQSRVIQLGLKYPPDDLVIQKLLTSDFESLSRYQGDSAKLLKQYLSTKMDLETINTLQSNLDIVYVSLSDQIAVSFLEPNLIVYQADNPEELFRDFFTFKIRKGDIIISEGQQVTKQVLDKLDATRDAQRRQDFLTFVGLALMFFIMLLLWIYYLSRFKLQLWSDVRSLLTLSFIMLFSLAVCIVIIRIPFPHFYYAVSLPLIIGSILVCIIYDPIFALYLFGALSLLVSWLFGFNTDLLIYNLVGVVAPPVFLTRMSGRGRVIKLGFILGGINAYLVGVVVLVGIQSYSIAPFVIGAFCGIAGAIIALGSQLFLDQFILPLTRTKLADLADTNSKLLQQLVLKAPGTYNHSLVMSQMAEEAARSIGADPLLSKVGALYHDIGKVLQPQFFAENLQDKSKNPHSRLEPKSSYNIILQHIEKGVELAKKYRLPDEIIDFITTHHGTSVMKYFYHQASESDENGLVDPEEYSYPGPIPFSKETTLVNLADTIEAIVRARELSSETQIREVVDSAIDEKIKTNQLANSDVSVRDLGRIADSFVSVLVGIHHGRIKYPEDIERESNLREQASRSSVSEEKSK